MYGPSQPSAGLRLPPDVPRTCVALAEQGDEHLATLHHRALTEGITRDSYGVTFHQA
jgi:hypothetical protein